MDYAWTDLTPPSRYYRNELAVQIGFRFALIAMGFYSTDRAREEELMRKLADSPNLRIEFIAINLIMI
jgi:hypothetical protein